MVSKDQNREKKMMCFVMDDESEALVRSISFSNFGLSADIYRGDVAFAIEHIKKNRSPDILLIDVSASTFPVSSVTELAEVCEPNVEVIAIGERNDVGIFRDLIRAGVRDYFAKPIPVHALIDAIAEFSNEDEASIKEAVFHKTGKLVAVLGASGGLGSSTIATNVAWVLAEQKSKRVCLVDLDLQLGTIPLFMDLPLSKGLQELFESPERIDPVLVERYMAKYTQNLNVLSSQFTLNEMPSYGNNAIDIIVDILLSKFHYVLADLPRNFTTQLNKDVLTKSNYIIVMTDYSIASMKNTKYILENLKMILSANQEILIIANKVAQYTDGELTRHQYEEAIEREIDVEIPFDRQYPMKALRNGVPVMEKNVGPLVSGINAVVNHLVSTKSYNQPKKGILNYLFGEKH